MSTVNNPCASPARGANQAPAALVSPPGGGNRGQDPGAGAEGAPPAAAAPPPLRGAALAEEVALARVAFLNGLPNGPGRWKFQVEEGGNVNKGLELF